MTEEGDAATAPDDTPPPATRPPRPQARDLLAALACLTSVPWERPAPRSVAYARATLFFPLVGLGVGGVLAACNAMLVGRLPPWLLASVLVGVWEALGGATVRETWATAGHRWPAAVGLAGALLVKLVSIAAVSSARPVALLFAPMLARWVIVVLATGARDAAAPGRKFNAAISFREFALTSVFTFAVVFTIADAFGILVIVGVAALTLGMRLLAHRWLGGVSESFLLVAIVTIEATVPALCAVL